MTNFALRFPTHSPLRAVHCVNVSDILAGETEELEALKHSKRGHAVTIGARSRVMASCLRWEAGARRN
eukprot:1779100-Pleurochrysis_carterae.AAC.1